MNNPIATYRIQFHKDFTFSHFERIIPYLDKLGIKTIYASPIFEAVAGSQHGYDVVNPQRINPEIGTQAQLTRIHKQLAERGMGWLQDIVPNHMAFDPANTWLMDVLEKGQRSIYSCFFDIDWTSPVYHGRLMVPFLGDSLEDVLHKGELAIDWQDKRLVLAYYDTAYPLHLRSYASILQPTENKLSLPIQRLLDQLPDLDKLTDATTYSLRSQEWHLKLAKRLEETDQKPYLRACLKAVNMNRALLRRVIDEQEYRLCAHGETNYRINYRRFFTVNSLICLNIQNPIVFDHVHEHAKNLLKAGVFQGLRVDHIDGLYDPSGYLEQLREMAGDEAYIVVEKILESGEDLPKDWPVQGATGYQFLALVNNLFTQTGSQQKFTQFYTKLLGEKQVVHQELYDKKAYILDEHMRGELDNLYALFQSLNLIEEDQLNALPADSLKAAIREFLVQCPVYRYYGNCVPLKKSEAEAIQTILEGIRKRKPSLGQAADLLEEVLLTKPLAGNGDYNSRAIRFYQRCMQFTGPLMAKGVEDTLMYTYTRFIGHDEVGDSPEFFGLKTDEFHQEMLDRQAQWPLALNATSTHDTKRGEDVRSRLNVLTDFADEWFEEVEAWQELTCDLKQKDAPDESTASANRPDVNDEYFIYQTLVGAYPMPTVESSHESKRSTSSPGQDEQNFTGRLEQYLEKAMREAKRNSTYTEPNEVYEEATKAFARQLLDPKKPFWKRFAPFHRRIADLGIINSLAQVVLKCTLPGLPDIYQGCEGWDLSLVDPDNRRPVDYDQRQRWLDELISHNTVNLWADLWEHRYDARIKLWLIHTLLNERNQQVDLFSHGHYIPLQVEGSHQQHVLAFARRYERSWYIVAVPLGIAQLCREQETDAVSLDWGNTRIVLPPEAPGIWQHRLIDVVGTVDNGLWVTDLFTYLPLAVVKLE
ncbi:malto-oligosyltrehalose synthase [Spirosoma litoris]